MEIKKYVLLEDNSIIKINKEKHIISKDNALLVRIGFNDWVLSGSGKVIATSDSILELAREGDLVRDHSDIYELFEVNEELVFEVNEELVFYPDKEQKNITMLYKKVGNNFIGYEVN
jgi:hypothetical protein